MIDLFYMMDPVNSIHIERLEDNSAEYKILSKVTKSIISRSHSDLSELFNEIKSPKIIHIRQYVFKGFIQINPDEIQLFYSFGNDIITCLKFLRLRDMKSRHQLFNYLHKKVIEESKTNKYFNKHWESDINNEISANNRTLFLQGVVWATGIVYELYTKCSIFLSCVAYMN